MPARGPLRSTAWSRLLFSTASFDGGSSDPSLPGHVGGLNRDSGRESWPHKSWVLRQSTCATTMTAMRRKGDCRPR